MSKPLSGRVVVVIGEGSPLHRAIVLAAAEAGAAIALATCDPGQEFAVASIGNEVWAIGCDQLVRPLDALDPVAVSAFAEEVQDVLGRSDALVCVPPRVEPTEVDELSIATWDHTLAACLTVPFLAAQAFGRLMERAGAGQILLVEPAPPLDAAGSAAAAGLEGLARAMDTAWTAEHVRAAAISQAPIASATAHAIVAHLALAPR